MGYEVDTYQLMAAGTVCAAAAVTVGAGTVAFAGSDFVRGVIRVNVSASAGTFTQWGIVLQSSDGVPNWYPDYTRVAAIGTGQLAAAGAWPAGAPFGIGGIYPLGTTAPASGLFQVVAKDFPGGTFRVGVWGVGGTSITCGITGDFQKMVADNS
jgi:hypothetical protein